MKRRGSGRGKFGSVVDWIGLIAGGLSKLFLVGMG